MHGSPRTAKAPPEILFKDIEAAKATFEQTPFKIRTPNGTMFTYGNVSADHKFDVDAMAVDRIAEAQRVDPMPDPQNINVRETIDFVDFIARVSKDFQYLLAMPEIGQQYNRREMVLSASPGWKAFLEWKDIEHHRKTPLEAAKELLAVLVDRLRMPSAELRLMPLLRRCPDWNQPPSVTRVDVQLGPKVLSAQPSPAAEVGRAALVQPNHHVDAPRLQGRDHPVRAEEPVGQDDVAGLELGDDHPEQRPI